MAWQYTVYTPLFALSVLVSVAVAGYLLSVTSRARRDLVVVGLLAMLLGAAWWSLTDLVQVTQTAVAWKTVAERLEYVGGMVLVLGWFVFAFAYTDREEWVTRRVVVALSIPLGAGAILALTNPFDHLLWTDAHVLTSGSVAALSMQRTPVYYLYTAITYAIILAGIYVLLRFLLTSKQLYRGQALALLTATGIPTATNLASQFGVGPAIDVTPAAFTVSAVALVFAITHYRLLDLEPIARRRVVESMRDGYLVVDEADRIVDLNPSAKQLLGPGDTLVGSDARTHLPGAADLFDGGDEGQTELVFERGDRTQYVEAYLSPLSDAGDHLGRLVTLRDVTDRKGVENRYRTLIENSSDLIVVLGARGTITYVSPSVEHVLGLDTDDIVGMNVAAFVHPDDHEQLWATFEAGLHNPDAPHRFEYRVQHGDGDWRVLEGLARNLLDNPFVEGVVVNARDITERKQRERELERQNEQLAEFAGVVSHDLRNPLAIARGRLELARDRGDDADFEAVERAHERMDTIIDDLLTLTRQGRPVGETSPISIETVATDAWATVDTDGGTLSVADELTVVADQSRLRQLFENLFRNAVEHGRSRIEDSRDDENRGFSNHSTSPDSQARQDAVEHGSTNPPSQAQEDAVEHGSTSDERTADAGPLTADLTITVGALDGGGFYVEDDGPGIPATEREQVFEFGYTDSDEGTGLGLAIVAGIAEAHGWAVSVTDAATGGARFEFTGVETDDE